ncbi:MAG: putative drug exporter of the superfamily [Solirubrobacteraceae bacterium]|jgi:RND superfamily putative drug exporter|nr:putative drug exporter of the superfamily [Solirubrobacteraceae bacterium]
MASLLARVAGRRARWIIVAVWLLAVGGASAAQLPAKFADGQQNGPESFLPGDAESTKALGFIQALKGDQQPVVIVYHRARGLTDADRRAIAQDRLTLNTSRITRTTGFKPAQFSKDGSAALLRSQIRLDVRTKAERRTLSDQIVDAVKAVRDVVRKPASGPEVKVTGDASFSADAINVFRDIDARLLGGSILLVIVLLALIYRSPFFLWIPLVSVGLAEQVTRSLGYGMTELGVTVNGEAASILSILVLGAGTDYALLLVARYREELRRNEDQYEAMAQALRTAGPAILASGTTVVAALLCLMLAKVNGTSGLGPVGALGIVVAVLSTLTLLPALLLIFGRRAFWPSIPRAGDVGADETQGRWRAIGDLVARSPRRVAGGVVLLLAIMALGLLNYDDGLTRGDQFRDSVEAVSGQDLLDASFPGGSPAPTQVVVSNPEIVGETTVISALRSVPGVSSVVFDNRTTIFEAGGPPFGILLLEVVLKPKPFSDEALALIPKIRASAARNAGTKTLVGGGTAVEYDLRQASIRDNYVVMPLTLLVVFLVLVALLRSLVAPLLIMGTVVLSFAAALGVGAIVFDVIFGFPGSDPSVPLYAFVFLVALAIDYNIFLMARVREETRVHGTGEGMLRGLAVTGGVITSAGIVLAGVFVVLGVLPLVFLTEVGFIVAFGVLLDTFIVRSLLVPALTFELGSRIWWPSALAQAGGPPRPAQAVTAPVGSDPAPTG